MPLDISPLQNAINSLRQGLQRYQGQIHDCLLRDGLMHRLETTYEISHKMLKRFLKQTAANPELFDAVSFADLIRSGNEKGLVLGDWPAWRLYRDMRSKTSHTYDEDVALQVVAGIPAFLHEAEYLAAQLQQRLRHG